MYRHVCRQWQWQEGPPPVLVPNRAVCRFVAEGNRDGTPLAIAVRVSSQVAVMFELRSKVSRDVANNGLDGLIETRRRGASAARRQSDKR